MLALFSADRGERALAPVPDAHGWFCWELPAGIYLLYLLDDLHGGDVEVGQFAGSPPLRVLAALQVMDGPGPAYVGELVIDVEADWLVGDDSADYRVTGVQQLASPDDAEAWLASEYPGSLPVTTAGPMRVDSALTWLLIDYDRQKTVAALRRLGLE